MPGIVLGPQDHKSKVVVRLGRNIDVLPGVIACTAAGERVPWSWQEGVVRLSPSPPDAQGQKGVPGQRWQQVCGAVDL